MHTSKTLEYLHGAMGEGEGGWGGVLMQGAVEQILASRAALRAKNPGLLRRGGQRKTRFQPSRAMRENSFQPGSAMRENSFEPGRAMSARTHSSRAALCARTIRAALARKNPLLFWYACPRGGSCTTVRFGRQPQYMLFIVYAPSACSLPRSSLSPVLLLVRSACSHSHALEPLMSWSVALCFWGR